MHAPASAPVLRGVRILDMATFVAAPFSATLCADLGADVVKLELPGGKDPLRSFPPVKEGHSLYWKVANRGKRGVSLDVRKPEGRDVFLRMLPHFDVLVENFRTGTLDGWGLDKAALHAANPSLVILRVTGFGQTGPYKERAGFARIFEAMSGLPHLTGQADGPPQHMNYPLGDMIAGLFGAFAIAAAMVERSRHPAQVGREIDLSASEAILRLLEVMPVEYEQMGVVRGRTGSLSSIAAPSNVYRTRDATWLTLSASSDAIFARLCEAMGQAGLATDVRYATLQARLAHVGEVDALVAAWCGGHDYADIEMRLERAGVPCSRVNTIRDIVRDPQFVARKAIAPMPDPQFGTLAAPCIVPRFDGIAADRVPRSGPAPGEDTDAFLQACGIGEDERARLRSMGVI